MKKIKILFIVICLFPFVISVNFVRVLADDVDSTYVANYIENNLSLFEYYYNNVFSDETQLTANYVEYRTSAYNIDTNTNVIYLDFDNSNGYLVVGDNYEIYEIDTTSDLVFLRNCNSLFYSIYDGFLYETEDGYSKFEIDADDSFWNNVEYSLYAGQMFTDSNGSGMITDPAAYISDRYGSGFLECQSVDLQNYSNVVQDDYSIYAIDNRKEGNCTLSAMYGIMSYMSNSYSDLSFPSTYSIFDPTVDSFYSYYVNQLGYLANIVCLPDLYLRIRNKFISYGYEVRSNAWVSTNMANIYMDVMNSYDYVTDIYNRYARICLVWSFTSNVKNEIDCGYPTMFNTARGQYGSHSMVVRGYKVYNRSRGFWIFTWNEYKTLMKVNDNWHIMSNYFDLNAYANNSYERFASFLKVREYVW